MSQYENKSLGAQREMEQAANKRVAEELLAKTQRAIEPNPDKLAHQMDTDLAENLPPQLMAVVVGVLKLVDKL